MTREEEVITACKGFLSRHPSIDQVGLSIGFLDGAVWADEHPKNVWHDVSEQPQDNSRIVILYQYEIEGFNNIKMRDFTVHYFAHYDWARIVKRNFVKKWAYVADLLPKGGKK